jgi:ABC-type bacteriocin/lantibiotic exporter with double-glycine peptidase domain
MLLCLGAAYAGFQVFNVAFEFIRANMLVYLHVHLDGQLTLNFVAHLMDLPYSFFQQRTSGDVMVRLGSNNVVREILTSTVMAAFLDGSLVTLYLVLLMLARWSLTLIVVALAAIRVALMFVVGRRQRELISENLEIQARSQTQQIEMLSGMEFLKAAGLEHRVAKNWSAFFIDALHLSVKMGRLDAAFKSVLNLLDAVSTLALMFCGMFYVLRGSFTLGGMLAFNAIAAGFLGPLRNLVSAGFQVQTLEMYVSRIDDVLEALPEQSSDPSLCRLALGGAVALEDVSFRYTASSRFVLEHISLSVSSGSRIAIVGRSGTGKSTLARLITGLYEPTSGRLLLDGVDFSKLDRRFVRAQLGMVTQEVHLFTATIRENIGLANPEMPLSEIVDAAKRACIHDDIMRMPMGYETRLTDRGLTLSGGQRQRVALARALANRPRILVLDEATSDLDAATENQVNYNLRLLRCTQIVIAHRLTTIRDADLVIVLDNGVIVDSGTYEELGGRAGCFARLMGGQTHRAATIGTLTSQRAIASASDGDSSPKDVAFR